MTMKTTKAVPDTDKARTETSAISNLEAVMKSARERQSRTRSRGAPVPTRNIEDVQRSYVLTQGTFRVGMRAPRRWTPTSTKRWRRNAF